MVERHALNLDVVLAVRGAVAARERLPAVTDQAADSLRQRLLDGFVPLMVAAQALGVRWRQAYSLTEQPDGLDFITVAKTRFVSVASVLALVRKRKTPRHRASGQPNSIEKANTPHRGTGRDAAA